MKTKKLFAIALASILTVATVNAEINPSKRYVEIGLDLSLAAMQNAFRITDIMKKDLVIDLTELSRQLPDNGFSANLGMDTKAYISFNFKKFGFGAYAQVTSNFALGLSKDIFVFLGEGFSAGQESTTAVSTGLEAYAEVGVPVRLKFGNWTVKATPAVYVPVIYIPQPTASITVKAEDDGTINATANADFAIYSIVDTSSAFAGGTFTGFEGILSQLQQLDISSTIFGMGGFDLGVNLDYAVSSSFDLGAYAHIPIKPAELNYKTSGNVTFTASVDPILTGLTQNGSLNYSFEGPTFSGIQTSQVAYAVNRPFRLGAELAWRPFGGKNWFVLNASGGVAATNPFGEDFNWKTSLYPEYEVSADLTLFYVLGLTAKSSYRDRMFSQSVGVRINMRILELDVTVGSSSADFLKSWYLAGASAYAGIRLGF